MVIAQQPAQSLAALKRQALAVDVCAARKQEDVVLPLMIALTMIIFDVTTVRLTIE
jgi:hypothetical protein